MAINVGFSQWMVLFHGKSENKMDDLGVPPFRKSPYTLDVAEMKIPTDQIGYRP